MSDPLPLGSSDPGVALALGSAFLGMYAHGGFLCGLNQAGIFPGHISGSSAGAIAGGFYAAGFRGADLEDALFSSAFKRSFTDPGMLVRWIPMLFGGKHTGIMSGRRMIGYLQRQLPVRTMEEISDVKLSIAVTDVMNREARFLTRGPLAASIMASCAVPLLFSGQYLGGTEFHDGGILHELPIEPFVDAAGIHTIILHSLAAPAKKRKHLKVPRVFLNSHQMLNDALLDFRRKEAERNGKRVIVVETGHTNPGFFQSKATKKRYFETGYQAGLALQQAIAS